MADTKKTHGNVDIEMFQTILDSAKNVHFVYLDREFNFLMVNEAYAKTCGYQTREMIGKNHFDLYPNEENETIFRRVRDSGEPAEFHDKPFVFPDQPERGVTYWDWTLVPTKDDDGLVMSLVFSLIETTERKRSEERTRQSEEKLRLLHDTMLQGVVFQDGSGNIISMNRAAGMMLGKDQDEFIGSSSIGQEKYCVREDGSPFSGLDHPAMVALRTCKEVKDVVMGVWNPRESDYRWINVTAVPLFRPGEGVPYQVYTIFDDITERRRAEESIRESDELYRAVFENSQDGFSLTKVIYDDAGRPVDGIVLEVNKTFEAQTGLRPENVVGKSMVMFHPRYRESLLTVQDQVLRTGRSTHIERRQDSGRWLDFYMFPHSKNLVGQLIRDITDRKKAEEELKEANELLEARVAERTKELKASNSELQQFAYVASHDLQEPLRMISSYLELLDRKYQGVVLDEKAEEYIQFAVDGASRMQQLIKDLLVYSRIENRKKVLAQVSMDEVMTIVAKDLTAAMEKNKATIVLDPLPTVNADKTQMILLMENLIGNGIKFHREEAPRVHVTAREDDAEWTIAVADNGIGIDPKFRNKLFQMFQRLHTREEYEGTGIGLAIAKKIVEQHGGRIWFESEPGKGATFLFSLPKTSDLEN